MKVKKNKFEETNLNKLNLKEICRFCLSDNNILLPIFGYSEKDRFVELPILIKSVLSIEVEEDDDLPSLICHSCLYNIEQAIDFKNQCELVESILRKHIAQQRLKDEIVGETNDDDCSNLGSNDVEQNLTNDEGNDLKQTEDSACNAQVSEENTKDSIEPMTSNNTPCESEGTNKSYENEKTESTTGVNQTESNENIEKENLNIETENSLQMEENMNDLEESMFGSEPFSLDLCSVRLRSECKDLDMEDVVMYPSTQLTDEEQWSESGSEISDDFDNVEPVHVSVSSNHCPTCNKGFSNITDLQRHQLIHKQEPPYPCDYCDQEFDEKTLLKAHWRTHAKHKPHMCLTCGEAYMERSELVKHFAVHDLIKPYHCPGCGKAFAYRSDLRKHAIIHTGARPFKCPVCGKTFTRSTNLNKHARVHTGRRPYPCENCDKMFSSRGDLVRHAVIHTGEKPYACLICSLAFNRKDKLSRHERVHMTDRPFVCSECPTSFHRKEELTKHCRFHHFKPDPEYYTSGE